MTEGRRPCLVPFCPRTFKREEDVEEVICGPHARLADKRLRKLLTLNRKRLDKLQVIEENRPAAMRLLAREERLWAKVKAQAISRAAGFK